MLLQCRGRRALYNASGHWRCKFSDTVNIGELSFSNSGENNKICTLATHFLILTGLWIVLASLTIFGTLRYTFSTSHWIMDSGESDNFYHSPFYVFQSKGWIMDFGESDNFITLRYTLSIAHWMMNFGEFDKFWLSLLFIFHFVLDFWIVDLGSPTMFGSLQYTLSFYASHMQRHYFLLPQHKS